MNRLKKIPESELIPILQTVQKPGRYVGGEFGIPRKNPDEAKATVILAYPDTYEIGMSNQGLKILYDRINRNESYLADRTFLPWPDFGDALLKHEFPLYSLDHKYTVSSFDLLGFNVSHELLFTNILYFLEMSQIPLRSDERTEDHPIVMAGGTSVTNPLPLFSVMDALFLGDGEEGILEVMETILESKKNRESRKDLLQKLSRIEGVMIPSLYSADYSQEVPRYAGPSVCKRTYRASIYGDLEYFLVPNMEITQDRVVLETARGCGQGCRFCHAGFWKRPVRNSETEELIRSAQSMLARTGNDSISLHSLSLADHPDLEELVLELGNRFGPRGISLSLPSLRVDGRTLPVLELTSGIRKSSVTFALEAGSEYLRARIRKRSSEDHLKELVRTIFQKGWDLIKIYFMIGLPDDRDKETEDLIRSLNELGEIAKSCGQRKNINVTVSLFVPKPHTTFQWEEQKSPEYFRESVFHIKRSLTTNRVHVKYPDPHMAFIEGILSRSDDRMGEFILRAYKKGARFDSWDEFYNRDLWNEVLAEIPEEWIRLWTQKREGGSPLPYDHIMVDSMDSFFLRDYEKFQQITPENYIPYAPHELKREKINLADHPPVMLDPARLERAVFLEIEYSKTGPFIYVSHLDTAESIRKAARRSSLPMTFSGGFNKHEKLHFTEPLPLFTHSESERIYIELFETIDVNSMTEILKDNMPPGLTVIKLTLYDKLPALREESYRYRFEFFNDDLFVKCKEMIENAPEEFFFIKEKVKKKRRGLETKQLQLTRRIRGAVGDFMANSRHLELTLPHPDTGAISMSDLVIRYWQVTPDRWNTDLRIVRIPQNSVPQAYAGET